MFTGIIDHCGEVLSIVTNNTGLTLEIKTQFNDLKVGESISVDGTCLTIARTDGCTFICNLSPETLLKTRSSNYQISSLVNLERAMSCADRFGGHFVSGHVDSILSVVKLEPQDNFLAITLGYLDPEHASLASIKGSITINGVSLTINTIKDNCISMTLIPHTLEKTNLRTLSVGDPVNVEYDMLAKMVRAQLGHH